ncbi:unnamed protein product [Linum tenue]|uniref:Uncharacterized protein n=1 Tax=Linum tenue TaxID=586396 RepID=A0AAV0P8S3_9ROSI|nr:unnamed protein product [Linum tenue]
MIGDEAFSLIDKHFYAGGQVDSRHKTHQYRRTYHYASQYQNQQQKEQQPCVYYGPRTATVTVKVPAATEATRYYYGGSFNQPAASSWEEQQPPVMTCDEAAQKFGGLVIADHGARSRKRSSQLGF